MRFCLSNADIGAENSRKIVKVVSKLVSKTI
jgi:hypothetical protein